VLVERKRRSQNNGGSMMQKAMELKKKKNLEHIKGNKIDTLQFDDLNKISCDVNIKVGNDKYDKTSIIDNLIRDEIEGDMTPLLKIILISC
jgi:hypothetical protein